MVWRQVDVDGTYTVIIHEVQQKRINIINNGVEK